MSRLGLDEAYEVLPHGRPDVLVLDLDIAERGPEAIARLRSLLGAAPLLVISSERDAEERARCLASGVDGYYAKEGLDPRAVVIDVQGLAPRPPRSRAEELLLQTRSPAFRRVVETCLAVAPTRARVLLLGETGTGKEVLARAIHGASGCEGPFVAVNCAAVSKGLMQAELFGHERGAFTGAIDARAGLFQQANGGTLFLDEIGDMPLSVQAATLRVLEEGTIRPVGSTAEREVDVRVVAATSVWLEDAVREGRFREDLLYRLDVIRGEVPALRDRPADIVPLFAHFCAEFAERHGAAQPELAPCFEQALLGYPWPGNVRQLANIAERLLLRPTRNTRYRAQDLHDVLGSSERLPLPARPPQASQPEALQPTPAARPRPTTRKLRRWVEREEALPAEPPRAPAPRFEPPPSPTEERSIPIDLDQPLKEVLDAVERSYLDAALELHDGHVSETADAAGLSRRTLLRKLKKHGMRSRDYGGRGRKRS